MRPVEWARVALTKEMWTGRTSPDNDVLETDGARSVTAWTYLLCQLDPSNFRGC